ncbi:Chloride channel protein clh-3 [Aphelenchoides bicaudatus]|nr:Chloride channel protein clh-3 [Aphelenchoides bicaudatus]
MSRFTVTSVVESNENEQEENCPTCEPPSKSRSNSVTSSEHESECSSKNSNKRHGTFASNVVHGLADAITHLSTGRYPNRHKFETDVDLHGEERKSWEQEQLAQTCRKSALILRHFNLLRILLYSKSIHCFRYLGLNRAYVTQHGKLIGVVTLHDIRIAIEMVNQNKPIKNDEKEQEAKRIIRSMSIKESEDIKNDQLNPQLLPISRSPSMASIQDDADRSFISMPDKRLSTPHFLPNPNGVQRRPWQSMSSPAAESIRIHDSTFPQINITPPKEETDSVESSDGTIE